jgi:adenosylcobinamide kinase / adenosylcobinamide-phosphate guanylyltransferase
MRELILGGQKSGKTRAALARAAAWLEAAGHEAVLVATAQAHDAEMAERIARHRADRAVTVPGMVTHEEPFELANALAMLCAPQRLVVVDCLTLWLTQQAMPVGRPAPAAGEIETAIGALVQAVREARGPLILVSNEIGQGLSPLGAEVRRFIDLLGTLHQRVAAACQRVTMVVAGCEWSVKGGPQ